MPYRQEISWDQTYNDVYLLDLKTGKPKKVLEHWGNAATMSPGGQVRAALRRERTGHWLTYRVADGARVNLTEKMPVKFQQENNTPDLPGAVRQPAAGPPTTSRSCSTTSSTSGK